MKEVDLKSAEEQFFELIELVTRGQEVIISKNKLPLVKMTPMAPNRNQRVFGSAKGKIEMEVDFDDPLEDFEEYR